MAVVVIVVPWIMQMSKSRKSWASDPDPIFPHEMSRVVKYDENFTVAGHCHNLRHCCNWWHQNDGFGGMAHLSTFGYRDVTDDIGLSSRSLWSQIYLKANQDREGLHKEMRLVIGFFDKIMGRKEEQLDKDWQAFKMAELGFRFSCPPQWVITDIEGGVELSPPGTARIPDPARGNVISSPGVNISASDLSDPGPAAVKDTRRHTRPNFPVTALSNTSKAVCETRTRPLSMHFNTAQGKMPTRRSRPSLLRRTSSSS